MKIFSITLLLFVLAGAVVFGETQQRVTTDAEILLGIQEDRAADNRLFLDSSVLMSYENRIILNNYRVRFNAVTGRIQIVRHQITNALQAREPSIDRVNSLRDQMQNLVNEHESLLNDFRQWISSIR